MKRIILASSLQGDLILDPFLGSGTTAYCAKKLEEIRDAEQTMSEADWISACNLGIEALKLVQRERLLGINPVETLLPGESVSK